MRSGTSEEQLLEQQQELELIRLARLRELEKNKLKFSERKFKGKNLRDHTIFYTTATLVFFSVSGNHNSNNNNNNKIYCIAYSNKLL